ncbi:hypothetical protein EC957_012397 [Mortierella hygrophila]|uniref:Dynactin subunit 3 n=1 Tax=Mortierella hygrophila TaxID=979708 RepID=A0A9P6F7B3_9FUNG|nr:hypothetical protein EC957_012397 [Mortierella hygrophila]
MLGARSNTSTLNGASSGDEQQLQDLESLSQRIRALETLLAPSTPAATTSTSPAAARASGSGSSGVGATSTLSLLSHENESPMEDATQGGGEDIVSTSASSSPRGGRVGGDPHLVQQHPSRNHHHYHSHEMNATAAGSLSRRIQKIETTLWAAAKERKPTEEFLQKYEASNLITPANGSHSDRELLTLLAKTELILAAQDELLKLSEESKDIQSLQRCAEIGGLKNVESQYPVLSKLETIHIEQCQESNIVSDRVNKLTDDYNGLINTLSEVFLSWDALLTAAELKVSEVEKSRV